MAEMFQTQRLRVRELEESDLGAVAAMLADPDVMRYWPRPYTFEEAAEWIRQRRRQYAEDGFSYWLALNRASGAVVGQVGLLMHDVEGVRESGLGYILDRPWWGRGLATEGALGVLQWAFRTQSFAYVACLIRPENTPSLRVAERLGLRADRLVDYKGFVHWRFVAERERFA